MHKSFNFSVFISGMILGVVVNETFRGWWQPDIATSFIPGWHTTFTPAFVFLPYKILTLLTAVQLLLLGYRWVFQKPDQYSNEDMARLNRLILYTGIIAVIVSATQIVGAFMNGIWGEQYAMSQHIWGAYALAYGYGISLNLIFPLLFLFQCVRSSVSWTVVICFFTQLYGIIEWAAMLL